MAHIKTNTLKGKKQGPTNIHSTMTGVLDLTKGFLKSTYNRARTFTLPLTGPFNFVILSGILNLFLFGIGTLVMGVLNNVYEDVFIGFLQMVPIVGWVWSVVWGVSMIVKKIQLNNDPHDANNSLTANDNSQGFTLP